MKIYAKQIAPEFSESPLFLDEWPENVYIFGNSRFNDPDGEYIFHIYTHEWRDDGKRAEIADAAGVAPADVVLYVFDGYIETAEYRTVTS